MKMAKEWYGVSAEHGNENAANALNKMNKAEEVKEQQTLNSVFNLISHASKTISTEAIAATQNTHEPDQKTKMQTHIQKVQHGHNKKDHEQEMTY